MASNVVGARRFPAVRDKYWQRVAVAGPAQQFYEAGWTYAFQKCIYRNQVKILNSLLQKHRQVVSGQKHEAYEFDQDGQDCLQYSFLLCFIHSFFSYTLPKKKPNCKHFILGIS